MIRQLDMQCLSHVRSLESCTKVANPTPDEADEAIPRGEIGEYVELLLR